MASAAPGKDNGPKSQPSSEPVPHSAELIQQVLGVVSIAGYMQYNARPGSV